MKPKHLIKLELDLFKELKTKINTKEGDNVRLHFMSTLPKIREGELREAVCVVFINGERKHFGIGFECKQDKETKECSDVKIKEIKENKKWN